MLEPYLPSNNSIVKCFLSGDFYYDNRNFNFPVTKVKTFIELLRSCSKDKKNIIIINLCSVLDSKERYTEQKFDDDIPF